MRLRELPAVRAQDQGCVQVLNLSAAEGLSEAELRRCQREEIRATNNLRDPIPDVIPDHSQMIADHPISSEQDWIPMSAQVSSLSSPSLVEEGISLAGEGKTQRSPRQLSPSTVPWTGAETRLSQVSSRAVTVVHSVLEESKGLIIVAL